MSALILHHLFGYVITYKTKLYLFNQQKKFEFTCFEEFNKNVCLKSLTQKYF